MRIGIFTETYLPTINGVVTSIETFRNEMEKRGHEYFIFAPAPIDKNYKEIHQNVYRFKSFNLLGPTNYPVAIPMFRYSNFHQQFKDLKLDIIHTQHLFNMGRLGLHLGKKFNIPVVHTYHTLITEYTHYVPVAGPYLKPLIKKMSRDYCNQCQQIITPSPAMKRELFSYGVVTPIEPIPTGISLKLYQNVHPEKLKKELKIPLSKKVLLFVGRLAEEKNLPFLFNTFKQILSRRDDVVLLIVGGGPAENQLKQLAKKLKISEEVIFTGAIEPKLAKKYFAVGDIFTFPSITDTQGIVNIEAMAAGVPVIAVNRLGPTDIIKDGKNGYLVDLNIVDFRAKIEYLLNENSLRKKMGKEARKTVEVFSAKNCALKMEKLYEQTIARFRQQSKAESEKRRDQKI